MDALPVRIRAIMILLETMRKMEAEYEAAQAAVNHALKTRALLGVDGYLLATIDRMETNVQKQYAAYQDATNRDRDTLLLLAGDGLNYYADYVARVIVADGHADNAMNQYEYADLNARMEALHSIDEWGDAEFEQAQEIERYLRV